MRIFPKLRRGSKIHNLDITLVNKFQPDPQSLYQNLTDFPFLSLYTVLLHYEGLGLGLKFYAEAKGEDQFFHL